MKMRHGENETNFWVNSLCVKEHVGERSLGEKPIGKESVGEKHMREKSVSESTHGLGGTRGRVGSRKYDRDCYRGEKSVCVKPEKGGTKARAAVEPGYFFVTHMFFHQQTCYPEVFLKTYVTFSPFMIFIHSHVFHPQPLDPYATDVSPICLSPTD